MMVRALKFLLWLLLLSAAFPAGAQDSSPEYTVSVTSITVWVKATDSAGKAVQGLAESDFEVYEDNNPVPISCFEEITTSPAQQAATQTQPEAAAQNPPPKFVIFLDLLNMTPQEYLYIRPRLQEFVDQVQTTGSEVELAALLPSGKLGIVSQFNRDTAPVRKALLQAGSRANATRDQSITNNRRQITQLLEEIRDDPRVFETMVRNAYRLAQNFARQDKETALFSLAALEAFSNHLASTLGGEHAAILYISGGFNSDPGRQYFEMIDTYVSKQGTGQDSGSMAINFGGSTRETNFDLRSEIQKNVGRLNRNNITLYSINTRGNSNAGEDLARASSDFETNNQDVLRDYQDSLWQIAKETGGISFENTNNFKVGFDRVLADTSQEYEICYSPPPHKVPGKYHRIKVVVKRPGISVRYRQGYTD